jgi:hypothetical protein
VTKASLIIKTPLLHFPAGGVEFELSNRVSVFVGRNNIGKSRLIRELASWFNTYLKMRRSNEISFQLAVQPDEKIWKFRNSVRHYSQVFDRFAACFTPEGVPLKDRRIVLDFVRQSNQLEAFFNDNNLQFTMFRDIIDEGLIEFTDWQFPVFMAAERDIRPSAPTEIPYSEHGDSLVYMTHKCLVTASGDTTIIEKKVLSGLNSILAPDYTFDHIRCQDSNGTWEIYLESAFAPKLSLDNLGSGVKTIFHALMMVHGYASIYGQLPTAYVFEELENNLHPRAVRRLIDYIIGNIDNSSTRVVFSTHSQVVVDHVATKHAGQIHHLFRTDEGACCLPVRNYGALSCVIDDLGIKASELLQANFVIWVEGPTELIVVPYWISKIAPELTLGSDYVVASYGGKLLLHFSAEVPNDSEDTRVDVARLNRNFAFVMDNDKSVEGKPLTPSKQAIINAKGNPIDFELWVTNGREIEDYYPDAAFIAQFGDPTNGDQFSKRVPSWGYKHTISMGWALSNQESKKLPLAKKLVELGLAPNKEVEAGLMPIVEAIRRANV